MQQTAVIAFMSLLEYKKDFSQWNLADLEKDIAALNLTETYSLDIVALIRGFVSSYPPFQANVFLHEYTLALANEGCSPATVKNYRSDIDQFIYFTRETDILKLLSKPKIIAFLKYEHQKGLRYASVYRKLVSITQFVLWAEHRGILVNVSPSLQQLKLSLEDQLKPANATDTIPNKITISPEKNTSHSAEYKTLSIKPPSHSTASGSRANQEYRTQLQEHLDRLGQKVKATTHKSLVPYLNFALIVMLTLGVGYFGYTQLFRDAPTPFAYPTTPTRPARSLSFQGRLTDTAENPITTATDMRFKLFDAPTGGAELWDSSVCSVTPDQDGIFSTGLGDGGAPNDCGPEIDENVFSENASVYLEVTIDSETLTPRQPIKAVAYALNSETLQGYPIDPSGTAMANTVVTMDENGQVVLGEISPKLISNTGTFTIEAQALTLQTAAGSNGDITLNPDGSGSIELAGNTNVEGNLYPTLDGYNLGGIFNRWNLVAGTISANSTVTFTGLSPASDDTVLILDSSDNVARREINPKVWGIDLVDGTGTTNRVAYWSDSDTITADDDLFFDGTNVGIGTTSPVRPLDVAGIMRSTYTGSSTAIEVFGTDRLIGSSGGGHVGIAGATISVGTNLNYPSTNSIFTTTGGDTSSSSYAFYARNSALTDLMVIQNDGNVGIGTTTPSQKLQISGNMRLTGGFYDGTNDVGTAGYILSSTGSSTDWIDPATIVDASNLWQIMSGALSPKNSTTDVLIGGTSTASAKFAFKNVDSGTPTASISAGIPGATTLTADGFLGTTARQTLTLGNNTTGNIALAPAGSTAMTILQNGNIGVGTTNPGFKFQLSSGQLALPDGTQGAPSLTFSTDSDIGLFLDGSQMLNIVKNGGWLARFNDGGDAIETNVGRGIKSGGDLTVVANSTLGDGAGRTLTINGTAVSIPNNLNFDSNTLFINSTSNNVGIGTNSPGYKLDVAGNVGVGASGTSAGVFFPNTTTGYDSSIQTIYGSNALRVGNSNYNTYYTLGGSVALNAANSQFLLDTTKAAISVHGFGEAMRIDNGGNVGIGTTGATQKLDINGNVRLRAGLYDGSNSIGTSGYVLSSTGTATSWVDPATLGTNYWQRISGNLSPVNANDTVSVVTNAATALTLTQTGAFNALLVEDQASDTTPFVIDQTGNVGIGTSTPTQALDVSSGKSRFRSNTYNSSYLQIEGFAGDSRMGIVNESGYRLATVNGSACMSLGPGGYYSAYGCSGSIGWRIGETAPVLTGMIVGEDSSGGGTHKSLAIGTPDTPAMSGFGGDADIVDISTFSISSNTWTGSRPTLRYTAYDHQFRVNTGAGENNPGTEAMRIDSTGNIGIGTSGPSQKLHISGNMRLTGSFYDGSNSAGTSGYVLTSTGTATSWVDPATIGTNYWQRINGNISPITTSDTLSATSSAATVATFTSTGTNNAFRAGGTSSYMTIDNAGRLLLPDGSNSNPSIAFASDTDTGIKYGGLYQPVGFSLVAAGNPYVVVETGGGGSFAHFLPSETSDARMTLGTRMVIQKLTSSTIFNNDWAAVADIRANYTSIRFEDFATNPQNNIRKQMEFYRAGANFADGVGYAIDFMSDGADFNNQQVAKISTSLVNASNATKASRMNFKINDFTGARDVLSLDATGTRALATLHGDTYAVGNVGIGTSSPSQKLHISGNMRLTGNLYDENNSVGTPGQILSTTATGTDWIDAPSGTVDGSGTTNYVARWADSNTLTIGTLFDNGTSVGIGTTTPGATLDINGNINLKDSLLLADSGQPDTWLAYPPDNNNYLSNNTIFRSNSGTGANINGGTGNSFVNAIGGNFGVGTTSPATKLDVNGTIRANYDSSNYVQISHDSFNPTIGFAGGNGMVLNSISGQKIIMPGENGTYDLGRDNMRWSGVWSNVFRGTDGIAIGDSYLYTTPPSDGAIIEGNVGIGLSSPLSKLHVNTAGGAALQYGLTLQNPNGTDNSAATGMSFISDTGSAAKGGLVYLKDYSGWSRGTFHFLQNATGDNSSAGISDAVFSILNNGNTGIGDTTPDHKLDVNGNIGMTAGGYLNFGDTDGSSGYGIRDNSGTMQYKNSAGSWTNIGSGGGGTIDGSGTANYVARWSDSDTLTTGVLYDDGTNVGVGTTSMSYKLDVNGTFRASSTSNAVFGNGTTGGLQIGDGTITKTSGNIFQFGSALTSGGVTLGNPLGGSPLGAGSLQLGSGGSTGNVGVDAAKDIVFYTGGAATGEVMRLKSGGNVGIGLTGPSEVLDVSGNIRGNRFIDSVGSGSYFLDPAAGGNSLVVAGNIGIATLSPSQKLDVTGNGIFSGNLGIGGPSSLTNELTVNGAGRFYGAYTETTSNIGVHAGYLASSPRILFANGNNAQNWQIDNNAGNFRWYTPGVVQMEMSTTVLQLPNKILQASGTGTNYFSGTMAIGTTSSGTGRLFVEGGALGKGIEIQNATSYGIDINSLVTNAVGINIVTNGTGVGISANSASGTAGSFAAGSGTGGTFSSTSGYALTTGTGNVGIGNSAPDYLLEVGGSSRTGVIALTDSTNVSHSVTTIGQADTFGSLQANSGSSGGLRISGMSDDAGVTGLELAGYIGVTNPTDSVPAVRINVARASGFAGGVTALNAAETAFQVANNGTSIFQLHADGSSIFTNNMMRTGGVNGLGDSASMVPNNSFEIDNDGNNSADGWTNVTRTNSQRFNGDYSGSIAAGATALSTCFPVGSANGYQLRFNILYPTATANSHQAYFRSYTSYSNCTSDTSGTDSTAAINHTTAHNAWGEEGAAPSVAASTYWARVKIVNAAVTDTMYIDAVKVSPAALTDAADLAEWTEYVGQTPEAGSIMSIAGDKKVMLSQVEGEKGLAGVVSTHPHTTMGAQTESSVALALAGRVPVIVTTANGQIKAGEYVTSSNYSGIGMKAKFAGQVIGKAMESTESWESCPAVPNTTSIPWPEDDGDNHNKPCFTLPNGDVIGKIMMLIDNSWYQGDLDLNEAGQLMITQVGNTYQIPGLETPSPSRIAAFSQAIIAQVRAGLVTTKDLVVEQTATIANLNVDNLTINGQSLADYIASINGSSFTPNNRISLDSNETLDIANSTGETVALIDESGNTSFSGKLTSPLAQIDSLEAVNASISGTTSLGTLLADTATVESLVVQDASISGEINANSARLALLESRVAEFQSIKAQTADLMDATVSGTLYAENIANFEQKVAAAMNQPSLLASLLNQLPQNPAPPENVIPPIENAGYNATGSGQLNKTLADLNLDTEDVVLLPSAVFIDQYLKVNGIAYVADQLGVGNSITVGDGMNISAGTIAYTPSDTEAPLFKIQPSGKGTLELMAGLMTLTEDGSVTINGNLAVNGNLKVGETLLTDLLRPTDFGNPFQVQVAGLSANASGDVQQSRFEIVNENKVPVATISAQGKAQFADGINIGSENLGSGETLTSTQSSGRATLASNTLTVTIKSTKLTENSLIYITPVGSTNNQVMYVKSQAAENPSTPEQEGQFIVGFDTALASDVVFNWWIVN